jgi:hypothetical protein
MNCSGINSKAIYLAGVVKLHMGGGAVRPPGPSNRENHRKLLKWAQNYSQPQPQDSLIKAKQATRKSWKKWNLHQASLRWLDLLPRAVWPPVPSGKLLHGKPCKQAQNRPRFYHNAPLNRVNKHTKKDPSKTKLHTKNPRAVRPPTRGG